MTTERPSVNLTLTELDPGSWVIFELPGFTTAAAGAPQSSLDALRKASATSYFKDKDALWVKVVSVAGGRTRGRRQPAGQPLSGFRWMSQPPAANRGLFLRGVLRLGRRRRIANLASTGAIACPPAAALSSAGSNSWVIAGNRGVHAMRKHRPFLFALLVPAFFVASGFAAVEAAQTKLVRSRHLAQPQGARRRRQGHHRPRTRTWSSTSVPPALGGLTIDGKLSFSNDADLELTTEWIMVHGELAIGTEARPHTRKATITLTDNVKGEDVMGGMGDRGIMLSGGTLNLHGDRKNTWTKLASTAEAGSTSIEVLERRGLARR